MSGNSLTSALKSLKISHTVDQAQTPKSAFNPNADAFTYPPTPQSAVSSRTPQTQFMYSSPPSGESRRSPTTPPTERTLHTYDTPAMARCGVEAASINSDYYGYYTEEGEFVSADQTEQDLPSASPCPTRRPEASQTGRIPRITKSYKHHSHFLTEASPATACTLLHNWRLLFGSLKHDFSVSEIDELHTYGKRLGYNQNARSTILHFGGAIELHLSRHQPPEIRGARKTMLKWVLPMMRQLSEAPVQSRLTKGLLVACQDFVDQLNDAISEPRMFWVPHGSVFWQQEGTALDVEWIKGGFWLGNTYYA